MKVWSQPELPTIQPVNHVLLYNLTFPGHTQILFITGPHWLNITGNVYGTVSTLFTHHVGPWCRSVTWFSPQLQEKIWEWPGNEAIPPTHLFTYSHVIYHFVLLQSLSQRVNYISNHTRNWKTTISSCKIRFYYTRAQCLNIQPTL